MPNAYCEGSPSFPTVEWQRTVNHGIGHQHEDIKKGGLGLLTGWVRKHFYLYRLLPLGESSSSIWFFPCLFPPKSIPIVRWSCHLSHNIFWLVPQIAFPRGL